MRSLAADRAANDRLGGPARGIAGSVLASSLLLLLIATPASAQPRPPQPKPAAPTEAAPLPQIADMMTAVPGGITAEQVGARAAATSYQAKAAEETANAAGARADQAKTNFIPRVGFLGRYTRLSEFTPPSFVVPGGGPPVSFPLVFNQWLTQATIAIPISDYFLKINQAYTATTKQEEAARYDVATARAKSFSDGKIAYFTWLRARGAVTVAEQSLAVARAHQKDAENQFAVGNASKADVLRAQTAVAAAELSVERAKSGVVITERQVRVATHAKEEEKIVPGESLDSPVPPTPQNVRGFVGEAHAARPEIKSIDKNADAARKLAKIQTANKYPSISGFGDVTYGNPNPRRFPVTQDWFPTWAVGAQISWSPNDFIAAGGGEADAEGRAAALDAQKRVVRDGIEIEVTQAYQAVIEADTAIQTTTRQLESAEEGYRVARELFNAGRGTSTTLIDAETALAQTRFEHLNAKVDARLARIRLEHAVGRDVK
jgi:outer membrane protein TolC